MAAQQQRPLIYLTSSKISKEQSALEVLRTILCLKASFAFFLL